LGLIDMKFEDFFEEKIEYPGYSIGEGDILSFGIMYIYVSVSLLNGMINYAGKPLRAYVLDRYRKWNEYFDKLKIVSFREPPDVITGKWEKKYCNTKAEIYDLLIQANRTYHTDIEIFQDDVLLLSKIGENSYWFFWFDRDVSDCCIGRFKTSIDKAIVVESFDNYVRENCSNNDGHRVLPNHCFSGWISFK
jgi:hypothetical protein